MDIVVRDGPLAGKTLKGIYELKDDTLSICMLLQGEGRPDDLTCKEGSNRLLQIYKKAKAGPAVKEPELRTELLARRKADQAGRIKLIELLQKHNGKLDDEATATFQAIAAEQHETDEKNTAWLQRTVDKHGWPGFALVGKDGAEAAFALAQHATDANFQKKCLEKLAAAVKAQDALAAHMAHLTDRIRVAANEKQVYGTEVEEKDGTIVAAAIEDEANVDKRRKAVGLPTLAESLKQQRQLRGITK
jgi:DNA primase